MNPSQSPVASPARSRLEQRLIWAVGLFVWLVYALHVVPGGGVNPNRYYDLTHSIVNFQTLNINAYHDNTLDKSIYQGNYYIAAFPGPSFLAIPSYLVFKVIYRFIPAQLLEPIKGIQSLKTSSNGFYSNLDTTEFFLSTIWINIFCLAIVAALSVVCLMYLLRRLGFSLSYSVLGALIYSFGTLLFFFSTTYFSHSLMAALIVFTLYQFHHVVNESSTPHAYFILGFLAACGVLSEYVGFALFGLVALLTLWRGDRKRYLWFVIGAVGPVLVLAAYNTITFGLPWALSHSYMIERTWNAEGQGLAGVAGLPTFERLWGLTFGLERGLFLFNPILLFAIPGIIWVWREKSIERPFTLAIVLLALSNFAYNIVLTDWRAGSSFGPRYLAPTMVCYLIPALYTIRRTKIWLWLPVLIISIFINWLGAQYGFAATLPEAFQTFLNKGPLLPALSAIVDHSSPQNTIHRFVLNARLLLMGIYTALLIVLGLVLFRYWHVLNYHEQAR